MKNNLITYNIKLKTDKQSYNKIVDTLELYKIVYNELSQWMFNHQKSSKKQLHDKNYYQIKQKFKQCPSQIIIRAIHAVWSTFKTLKSNEQLKDLEQAPIMKNIGMRLDKRICKLLPNNQIALTTLEKRIVAQFKPYGRFEKLFKTYPMSDPLIFWRNGQLWLSCSFKMPIPTHIEDKILGVDLGLKRSFVTSSGKALIDKKFNKDKRIVRYNKRSLRSKAESTNSSSAKVKLNKIRRKERNINKNQSHKIANFILKTQASTIILEDLSSLKKNKLGNKKVYKKFRNRLSQVPFYQILSILSYKALLVGKRVETVNPAFTSQDDFRGLDRGTRKGCRYFSQDKQVYDADWNASINIALRFRKNLQSVQLPFSFKCPFDGGLNLLGRPKSTGQS